LYGCKGGVCDDLALCYQFLEEIVDFIKMEKQAPPDIFKTDSRRWPDKAGLSGWVPLAESSIVIHTLSAKNFITIDVYSCKKFDNENVKQFVTRFFHPQKIEEHFIHRGKSYARI
jgi:S-adenosylmethionine decarboxylase